MLSRAEPNVVVRKPWLLVAVVLIAGAATLGIPLRAANASVRVAASGPVVKVGMLAPITSATAANPDQGEAFKAAVAAINKRGGVGTNGTRLQAVVCDTKGDANGEVGCARNLAAQGVVATIGDLAYNDPSSVDDVLQSAGITRIGVSSTGVGGPSLAFPLSTGIVGAYLGDAVGFDNRGKTKVALVRTDAATGAGFADFLRPSFKKAGVDIVGDVAIPTGTTDYAPFVAQIQRSNPDAVLLAIDDTAAAQLIAAMGSLNYKPLLGGHPGTFTLETLRKFKTNTNGTLLTKSFPYPSQSNEKSFPALKQFFADMKASNKQILDPSKIQPTSFYPWVSTLAFVNAMKNTDTINRDSVIQTLKTAHDIDLMGLAEPWTPSSPGFSVFTGISNPYVYVSHFDGKNVVTEKKSIDVSQYFR